MSESGYEWLLKNKKKMVEANKDLIKEVNNSENTPQEILWLKELSDELEDDTCKFEEIEGKYYFNEKLVNKLLHLTYLKLSKRGADNYQNGWDDCKSDILNRIEDCHD